jgi:uncharacterized membrane protein
VAWNRWYSLRSYAGSALWIVPFFAIGLFQVAWRAVDALEDWLVQAGHIDQVSSFAALQPAAAQGMLGTVVTMVLSFMVFTFGSLLVAIQIAGGQYTPRIIATALLRDNVIRGTVGLLVFTLLFANRTQNHSGETVRQLTTAVSGALGLSCIVAFLYLIDYAARMLRPVSLLDGVGVKGIAVIERTYPDASAEADAPPSGATRGPPRRVVAHGGKSAVVLAVNLELLVAEARRAGGMVEFAPQVGDFVATGDPLFRLHGEAERIDDARLRAAVAFGPERTIEQDPMFAFRIVIDIAIKALSPAINDPTTAVLAIDQVHRLLRAVGQRALHGEEVADGEGRPRVIFRTPDWKDFVDLALTEIRHCGAGSVQVARRLRAMLDDLARTLPEHRRPELRRELDLLDRSVGQHHAFPEDAALARVPDSQGLGGAPRR